MLIPSNATIFNRFKKQVFGHHFRHTCDAKRRIRILFVKNFSTFSIHQNSGICQWVNLAFGKRWGMAAIWLPETHFPAKQRAAEAADVAVGEEE